MTTRARRRTLALSLVLLLAAGLHPAQADPPPREDERAPEDVRRRDEGPERPADGELRAEAERRETERRQTQGREDRVLVEVLHTLGDTEARHRIREHGGRVTGGVPGHLVEAEVPWDELDDLEAADGIRYLRRPLEASVVPPGREPGSQHSTTTTTSTQDPQSHGSVVGEEVEKSNADAWHADGFTGAGVKVAIMDFFGEAPYDDAQAAGEVPAPADTFCRWGGSSCDVFEIGDGDLHGPAIAEIVHEMAPDAELYLVTAGTASDHQAAVNWLANRDVDVVTRSLGSTYDGPGDGTGPMDAVFEDAVAKGMAVFNAVGNSAGRDGLKGTHWRGTWSDTDGNGSLEFESTDEALAFPCSFVFGVRWDDWDASNPTDYDVVVTDSDLNEVAESRNRQTAGAPPLEHVDLDCDSLPSSLRMFVTLHEPGNGTSGDVIQLQTGRGIEHWTNPHSATTSVADSASPGVSAVGAIEPATETEVAPYSSEGPTNDGRTKPDLSAPAGVDNFTFGTFSGTSASSPAAAGAAALVLGAGEAATPSEVQDYLETHAAFRGDANLYGAGELLLPSPPDADGADLRVAAADSVDPVEVGGSLTYTIDVRNDGPQAAADVTLDVDLPEQVTDADVADTGPFPICTVHDPEGDSAPDVVCDGGLDLASGAGGAVDVDVTVEPETTSTSISLDAEVSSSTPDPDASDDTVTETTAVGEATCLDLEATIVGTNGADTLTGTEGADVIVGLGGDDTIEGLGGDDVVCAGDGDDVVHGNQDDDAILGEAGADTLFGDLGHDAINGGDGKDDINGGSGDDLLDGGIAADDLKGSPGNDDITGNRGDDFLNGGDGVDTLRGNRGADFAHAGPKDDVVSGGEGVDRVFGDGGDDLVRGDEGSDTRVSGGLGNDDVRGGPGDDFLTGEPGDDDLRGQGGVDTFNGGSGTDVCDDEPGETANGCA